MGHAHLMYNHMRTKLRDQASGLSNNHDILKVANF